MHICQLSADLHKLVVNSFKFVALNLFELTSMM